MITYSLSGVWQMEETNGRITEGTVPGSVYSFLLNAGLMEDPYYRENELAALRRMEEDFIFRRVFTPPEPLLKAGRVLLRCEGLDTLCDVTLNGVFIAHADNMHRTWELDVTHALRSGENEIALTFASPVRYIRARQKEHFLGGTSDAMDGFPHLRKAHCMFGWDWGPRLPDAGIWRGLSLIAGPRIENLRLRQRHENGAVWVTAYADAPAQGALTLTLTSPDGRMTALENGVPMPIPEPMLWWPRGYGAQPLYTLEAVLTKDGVQCDRVSKRIGLRKLTVRRKRDAWGESFAHEINGVAIFAMGADYIPEDNILSRLTRERTRRLLEDCCAANFNLVRVWGGGIYPEDYFYDLCDELGLLVWQDFMFACANYRLTEAFEASIRAEVRDNVSRLRHHACLALWCGNNEMEMFQASGNYRADAITRAHYIRMFEQIIPEELRRLDPDTFYWPASPSSGGSFDEPNAPDRGDVHYWEVWHGNLPFTDYRKHFFRYASEFGFQSFPCLETVERFTLPEERNIFSRVMEMHQRNVGANGKILSYLSQTYLYPLRFDTLLYASQLLQADAVRCAAEHFRRNRGRCMGAVYWQLNDIWPVASWSSIDWYGKWKALHYAARRFFAPVMISCEETGEFTQRQSVVDEPGDIETRAKLCVANETLRAVSGTVRWALRRSTAEILSQGAFSLTVPALSSVWCEELDFHQTDWHEHYLSFCFDVEGQTVSSGTALFTAPKHYRFLDPELSLRIEGDTVVVSARAFAKSVEIYGGEDLRLSDNFFDLNGGEAAVAIVQGRAEHLSVRSVYDIGRA